jgi:hypothetical protein
VSVGLLFNLSSLPLRELETYLVRFEAFTANKYTKIFLGELKTDVSETCYVSIVRAGKVIPPNKDESNMTLSKR